MLPDINTGITDRSLSAGVRGTSRGWDVDFGLTHGRNDFQFIIDNTVNASLGAASPTTFDAGRLAFAQTTGNLDLVRPLAIGGLKSVAFVTGAEFRLENYRIEAGDAASWQLGNGGTRKGIDYDTTLAGGAKQPGSQGFPGFQPGNAIDRSRTSLGVYAGLESQLTSRLLVDAGGRYESYSDFGNTINGKLAGRYEIVPNVAVRAAISTGFRAPSLQQSWFNNVSTQFVFVRADTAKRAHEQQSESRDQGVRDPRPHRGDVGEPERGDHRPAAFQPVVDGGRLPDHDRRPDRAHEPVLRWKRHRGQTHSRAVPEPGRDPGAVLHQLDRYPHHGNRPRCRLRSRARARHVDADRLGELHQDGGAARERPAVHGRYIPDQSHDDSEPDFEPRGPQPPGGWAASLQGLVRGPLRSRSVRRARSGHVLRL